MAAILRWYGGMLTRIVGYAWDVSAGFRCRECGWRSPCYEFICLECGAPRFP
jgi:lipopolysaccharide biosynthesis regulator YciM